MNTIEEFSLTEFISRTGNLLIHLLDTCNLQCRHCYLGASSAGKEMLPIELVLRTLDEAEELGVKAVQLTGGEPLMYPGFEEVLHAAQGRSFQLSVSTNGTLIDDNIADRLAVARAFIVLSIDGPAEYHNWFRDNPDCFSRTEKGIARLLERGIETKMVTTISEENYRWIDWCAEWAQSKGIQTLQFQPLEQIGRGKNRPSARLSDDRLLDLYVHLNDLAVAYSPQGLKISMTYKRRKHMLEHPCAAFVCNGKNCHRGVEKELKKIVIREDGTILPELLDIDPRFKVGNLYQATLRDNLLSFLADRVFFFDQFCREVYNDVVAEYPSPLIPWNEILSERSYSFRWPNDKPVVAESHFPAEMG
jgi:MoaA/NifB/PqqE/SkfB family radical SAM enzyme